MSGWSCARLCRCAVAPLLAALALVGRAAPALASPAADERGGLTLALVVLVLVLAAALIGLARLWRRLKQNERALREASALHAAILDNTEAAVGVKDLAGRYILANRRLCETQGKTPADFLGRTNFDLLPREQAEALTAQDQKVAERGEALRFESWIQGPAGPWCALTHKFPLRDETGAVFAVAGIGTDITERKHAEEKLRESEEQYRNLVELLADGVQILQGDLLIYANPALCAITGRSREELEGKPFDQNLHPDEMARIRERIARRLAGEPVPRTTETVIRTKDGRDVPVEVNATVIQYRGRPANLSIVRDVTERRRAEEALRETNERLRAIVESATDVIFTLTPEAEVGFISPSVQTSLGYAPEELLGRSFAEVVHPDDLPACFEHHQEVLAGRAQGKSIRHRVLRKDGAVRWYLVTGAMVRAQDSRPRTVVAVAKDVTEQHLAEQELRRLGQAIESSPVVVLQVRPESDRPIEVASRNAASLGIDPDDVAAGRASLCDLMHLDDCLRVRNEIAGHLAAGRDRFNLEYRLMPQDGRTLFVQDHTAVERDRAGRVARMHCVLQDVTERRRVEEKALDLQDRFSQVISSIDQVVWLASAEGEMLYVNEVYEQFFGLSRESLYTNTFSFLAVVHPEDRERVQGIIGSEEFRAGGRMDLEYRIARPDTDVRWVRSRTFPVLKAGRLARLAGVTEDITPFKLAEEHLRRAKDQAEEAARAKTRFLASMSHEVKTPLNGVLGMLQVLGMGRLDAEQREHVAVAEGAAQGLLDLINDILDYSRLEEGQAVIAPQDFRVEDVLRGVIETFRGQAERKGIALSFAVDPSVPEMVRSDPGRLRQILFNLVGNAIKFTEKGFVRVEVCFFTAGRADGARNLLFSVLDSGKGIEPDKLDYIFEAFAQADESYARRHRGPGLGLAIVRRLVGFLGGALSVESEEGNGTAVHFSINVRPACVPSCPLT